MDSSGEKKIKQFQQAGRTAYLVAGFIRQSLTLAEMEELDEWINESEKHMRLFGELTDEKNIAATLSTYENIDAEAALLQVKSRIRNSRKFSSFWHYAIAAAIVSLVGMCYFLLMYQKSEPAIGRTNGDISPGEGRATLVLTDGKRIFLKDKDTVIGTAIHVNGPGNEIRYDNIGQPPEGFHTLEVPRKGFFKIILQDGTKVWLNAASSIRYPIEFGAYQRMVEVAGEAYFEIAKDPSRPFRVMTGRMMIQAIGTAFNVNTYKEEPVETATLIEGKVRIVTNGDSTILEPGQQASMLNGKITKSFGEIETVVAWKDNKFRFRNERLEAIMRQVSRWYDVPVEYDDLVDVHLNATISRNVPLSKLLELLQATGHVRFEIKSNKIIVSK